MRTYLMAGNWKMNKTIPETVVLTQQLCNQYNRKWDNVDIVLCPPAIDIKAAYTVLDFDKTKISLGAQNAHWEESGAFTGEISIPMIKDAGCEYCIVGHSERREMFNETDTTVNLKVKALVSAGIAQLFAWANLSQCATLAITWSSSPLRFELALLDSTLST